MLTSFAQQLSHSLTESTKNQKLDDFAKVLKSAWSELSTDSAVLSLNRDSAKSDNPFCHLPDGSKICILQLLYLQYDEDRLDQFCDGDNQDAIDVLNEVREQFVGIVEGVKAVQMDDTSIPIQHFLSADQHDYQYDQTFKDPEDLDTSKHLYFNLLTITRLFPFAEEISLNAKNWDFSLNTFKRFVDKWRLDFSDMPIKYINIQFEDDGTGRTHDERAVEEMKQCDADDNISALSRMGWRFLTPSKLSNVGFDPQPEFPFLTIFMEKQQGDKVLYRHYTQNLLRKLPSTPSEKYLEGTTPDAICSQSTLESTPPSPSPGSTHLSPKQSIPIPTDAEAKEFAVDDAHIFPTDEGSCKTPRRIEVRHNPKICFLSKEIWKMMESANESENYKDKVLESLKRIKLGSAKGPGGMEDEAFSSACSKVLSLILDPMPSELNDILRDKDGNVDYETISYIFPCGLVSRFRFISFPFL